MLFCLLCPTCNVKMRFVCCPNPLYLQISPYHLHVSIHLFQGTDAKEWKLVVQEIFRFLKADVACKTSRPLRYCVLYDPHPSQITPIGNLEGKKTLHLEDAILASYYHNEVGCLKPFLTVFLLLWIYRLCDFEQHLWLHVYWAFYGTCMRVLNNENATHGKFTPKYNAFMWNPIERYNTCP